MADKTRVVLLRAHEDNGVRYEVGAVLETDELTAKFLVTQKIGHRETAKSAPAAKQ